MNSLQREQDSPFSGNDTLFLLLSITKKPPQPPPKNTPGHSQSRRKKTNGSRRNTKQLQQGNTSWPGSQKMETHKNPGIKYSIIARAEPGRVEDRASQQGAVTGRQEGAQFEGTHCLV